jgi:hypothetical protein
VDAGRASLAALAGLALVALVPVTGDIARPPSADFGPSTAVSAQASVSAATSLSAAPPGPASTSSPPGAAAGAGPSVAAADGGTARAPGPAVTPEVSAPAAPPVGVPPARVAFPGRGVDGSVVPVGVLPGGTLQLPDDPGVVGWWAAGATPGAAEGTVVLAGHVDSLDAGVGLLAALATLEARDSVVVDDRLGGRHTFRVESRRSYPKAALPADVFATEGPRRLVLVTCGGAFDEATGHYADNVVVTAAPA